MLASPLLHVLGHVGFFSPSFCLFLADGFLPSFVVESTTGPATPQ